MRFNDRHKRLLLIFTLPAVLGLLINASVNIHIHQLSDGTYITHAHPYQKNPDCPGPAESHRHSKEQYRFLQLMSTPDIIVLTVLIVLLSVHASCQQLKIRVITCKPFKEYYGILTYRGPPSF